ncbi:UDP-N-acetyl glucosamine 2-epimerase [Candidatus Bathyarchaeota archaeon]|nr:UDP-N-acetyl glucosamine 2-epimerase [Candidatus Bathyarchaeota archaeon]
MAGTNPDKIVDCVKLMLGKKNDWENPFADGVADKRIIEILRHEFD